MKGRKGPRDKDPHKRVVFGRIKKFGEPNYCRDLKEEVGPNATCHENGCKYSKNCGIFDGKKKTRFESKEIKEALKIIEGPQTPFLFKWSLTIENSIFETSVFKDLVDEFIKAHGDPDDPSQRTLDFPLYRFLALLAVMGKKRGLNDLSVTFDLEVIERDNYDEKNPVSKVLR